MEKGADLRNMKIVTIDGADAKDLDDAARWRKPKNGNFRLGVHIADVAQLRRKLAVDKGSLPGRGTSAYTSGQGNTHAAHRGCPTVYAALTPKRTGLQ